MRMDSLLGVLPRRASWSFPEPRVNDGSSRLAIPLYRLGVVLRDALAVGVDEPESVLSVSVTLLGCLAKPIRYSRGEATFRLPQPVFSTDWECPIQSIDQRRKKL
jgi:hypothetical protein